MMTSYPSTSANGAGGMIIDEGPSHYEPTPQHPPQLIDLDHNLRNDRHQISNGHSDDSLSSPGEDIYSHQPPPPLPPPPPPQPSSAPISNSASHILPHSHSHQHSHNPHPHPHLSHQPAQHSASNQVMHQSSQSHPTIYKRETI